MKQTKEKTTYSDRYLQKLWREAVLENFGGCCFFCGNHKHSVEIECHHLIKRKNLLTRHDWRNGIPVCKYVCHSYAETPAGKAKIAQYQDKNGLLKYLQERSGSCKQWFVDRGITKNEFLRQMYHDLRSKISGVDFDNLPS